MEFTGERVVPNKMENFIGTYIEHLTRYVFSLGFCTNKKVLDVACGTGYGLELISSVAEAGVGIDIDSVSLSYAKDNHKFYGKAVVFEQIDLEKQTLYSVANPKTFDTVISFETIEHLENPEYFIENIKGVLKDDGHFIFSIPLNNPSQFHKKTYDFEEAKALIEKQFSKIEWYGQTGAHINEYQEGDTFLIGVAEI